MSMCVEVKCVHVCRGEVSTCVEVKCVHMCRGGVRVCRGEVFMLLHTVEASRT